MVSSSPLAASVCTSLVIGHRSIFLYLFLYLFEEQKISLCKRTFMVSSSHLAT